MPAKRSTKDKLSQLIEAGADPAATDDHGWNALRYVQRREPSKAQQAIVAMLGGKAPAGKGSNKKNGKTPARSRGTSKGLGRRIVARVIAYIKTWDRDTWMIHVGLTFGLMALVLLSGMFRDLETRLAVGFAFLFAVALSVVIFLVRMHFSSAADRNVDNVVYLPGPRRPSNPGSRPSSRPCLKGPALGRSAP